MFSFITYIIFLFFQLSASIFAPTTTDPSRAQDRSSVLISTTNVLCLRNIVSLKSGAGAKYRFHENELQLQVDLQASTLVADLRSLNSMNLHCMRL